MPATRNIKLIISLSAPDLDIEERDREFLQLISELKENPDVEEVSRVPMQDIPVMSKGAGSFLVGLLTAEISPQNVKPIFHFLYTRLSRKTIELEVEANGKRLKVSAGSHEDLKIAIQEAQAFISDGQEND